LESIHPIEQAFHQTVGPFFQKKGFLYVKAFKQYRSPTSIGFQCVIFSFSHYPELSILEMHLGIRADAVEQLAFTFTNGLPEFQADSLTLVTPMAKLEQVPFQRFELKDTASCTAVAQQLLTQLQFKGLPFLNHYSRLEQLHKLFNGEPEEEMYLTHNQINRYLRGITLARLTQAENFKDLGEAYGKQLISSVVLPEYQQKYKRLFHHLFSYSMN
jgi:hypothetical protein